MFKIKSILTSLLLLFIVYNNWAEAKEVNQKLYIHRGVFRTAFDSTFNAVTYNVSPDFKQSSAIINVSTGENLNLVIFNNDTAVHGFAIKSMPEKSLIINPGDSASISIKFSGIGTFIYYDHLNFPLNAFLGLSGMIAVDNGQKQGKFYWNMQEHHLSFYTNIHNGQQVDWSEYDPGFFTINGKNFPHTQEDTLIRVTGAVGDTILLFIANSGMSEHSLHFHGYHCKVLYSSADNMKVGWDKDTFPIRSKESVVLQMVPDKPGEYSVHDHNLLTMSGAGRHPFGMLLTMLIE